MIHHIMDEKYIVSNSLKIDLFDKKNKQIIGIYFLIKKTKVVYVGQSINIEKRINSHKRNKNFDRVYTIECEEFYLDAMESIYLHEFNPKLNARRENGNIVANISLSKMKSKIDISYICRHCKEIFPAVIDDYYFCSETHKEIFYKENRTEWFKDCLKSFLRKLKPIILKPKLKAVK